jgi:hypothetical protein
VEVVQDAGPQILANSSIDSTDRHGDGWFVLVVSVAIPFDP